MSLMHSYDFENDEMEYCNGVMGVPITFLDKYNPEQFEIVGEANHGGDNEYDIFSPTVNGKGIFKRILIKNKKAVIANEN